MSNRPTPTALKILQGNPGKRPLNKTEPKPPSGIPQCPSHLNEEARREWRRISRELLSAGLLTRVDRAALAAYCQTWSRWVEAEQQLSKLGENALVVKARSGYPMPNPYIGIANKALELMKGFLIEFGLTPSSRSGLHSDSPLNQEGTLAQLLNQRNRVRSRGQSDPD